jgi:hypothetical protein
VRKKQRTGNLTSYQLFNGIERFFFFQSSTIFPEKSGLFIILLLLLNSTHASPVC